MAKNEPRFLFELLEAMESKGARCWIDQGTLLGAYRDQCFLPKDWDHDFDLGLWWDDYNLNKNIIIETIHSKGWTVAQYQNRILVLRRVGGKSRKICIALYHEHTVGQAFKQFTRQRNYRSKTITICTKFIAKNTQHILIRSTYRKLRRKRKKKIIDIIHIAMGFFVRGKFLKLKLFQFSNYVKNAQVVRLSYADVVTPAKYFKNLSKLNCMGYDFWAPSDIEEYLKLKYGESWHIPKKKWNHLVDDGGVVK